MILSPKYPIDNRLLKIGGYLGFFSHLFYYFTWVYLIPQPYDSLWLRLSCCLVSVSLILVDYWPEKSKRWLLAYWHLFLMYVLTITCTYLTLKNNFSTMWMMTEVMAIFVLSILIDEIILLFFNLLMGIFIATVAYYIQPAIIIISIDSAPFALIPVILACSTLSNFSKRKGIAAQEKNKVLKSLAGSIAHEMRNPLSQIHGSLHMLERELPQLNNNEYTQIAHKVIRSGFQLIDLTMDAINEKPINKENFKIISAQNLVADVLWEYAFVDNQQKDKVSMRGGDFSFLADPVMLKYVFYNLIGNALYYVKTLPDAKIVITVLPSKRQIVVRDTGPGIEPQAIPKLFDSFYTSGKQGGTGLGLAYCKRSMKALGGDIQCRSKLGKYTVFVLSFPKVSKEFKSILGAQAV